MPKLKMLPQDTKEPVGEIYKIEIEENPKPEYFTKYGRYQPYNPLHSHDDLLNASLKSEFQTKRAKI